MRLGELKPKGSDKTLKEWVGICKEAICIDCINVDECILITGDIFERDVFFEDIEPFLNFEVEIPDKYFDTVDRIKPCPNCRYQLIHNIENTKTEV